MADLTLEILSNKEKYPDDRKIVLGDGEEITCGELRNTLQPRSAFTQASEKWSQRERELTAQAEGLQQQLQQALAAKEAAGTAPPKATATGGYSEEDILADPVLGPVLRRAKAAEDAVKALQERSEMHERYVKTREYEGRLATLQSRWDGRFNKDGKRPWDKKGFLEYVQRNPILSYNAISGTQDVDLETTYDKWSWNEEIAAREREAEERGYEKGKQTAKVPAVPFGRRRSPVKPSGLEGKSFQDITEEDIANDPEIQEAMAQDAGA